MFEARNETVLKAFGRVIRRCALFFLTSFCKLVVGSKFLPGIPVTSVDVHVLVEIL